MAYCMNCGEHIQSEELVCVTCGTDMGKIISNQRISSERGTIGRVGKQISDNAKRIAEGMIRTPVTSTVHFARELNLKGVLALLAAVSVLFSLFGMWIYEETFKRILKFSNDMLKVNINSGRNNPNMETVVKQMTTSFETLKMNKDKVFLIAIVMFLIVLAVTYAVFHIAGKYVLKLSIEPVALMAVVVCSSIPFVVSLYAHLILSYVALSISLIPFAAGTVVAMLCLYNGVKEVLVISQDKAAVILPLSYIAVAIAMYYYGEKLMAQYVTMAGIKRFLYMLINYLSGGAMYYF